MVELTKSFLDLRFTIKDILVEKGKVVVSWIISGTHQNEFMNIPATGSKIFLKGITIHHVANGKILDSHPRFWTCCNNSVRVVLLARRSLQRLDANPGIACCREVIS
jgi:SnoaL-like polyketide cyclase